MRRNMFLPNHYKGASDLKWQQDFQGHSVSRGEYMTAELVVHVCKYIAVYMSHQ